MKTTDQLCKMFFHYQGQATEAIIRLRRVNGQVYANIVSISIDDMLIDKAPDDMLAIIFRSLWPNGDYNRVVDNAIIGIN